MPEINSYEYNRVTSEDVDGVDEKVYKTRAEMLKTVMTGTGWMITTALLVAILWLLSYPQHNCTPSSHSTVEASSPYKDSLSPYKKIWTNCGSTPSEARKRGCKFDILSFAWQLPECYDKDIMEEFLAEKDWKFFQHPNGTSPVPKEAALSGEIDLYVTQEYHLVHCMYMWRQMHRAFTIQKHIDSHLNDYYHTLHCHHVMLGEQRPKESVGAIGALKYPTCQSLS